MMFGRKANGRRVATQQMAYAASTRIPGRELLQETVQFLLSSGKADRIGIWIESPETNQLPGCGLPGFQGVVADRSGEVTPSEWEKLSREAPLPLELLNVGN